MGGRREWALAGLVLGAGALGAARGGPGPFATGYAAFLRAAELQGLRLVLAGRADSKAAFLVFVGSGEVKEPAEKIALYRILRDEKRYPIHGFWIDLEHNAINGDQLREFAALARAVGFAVVVRVRENRFANFKEVIGLGVDGLVVPSITGPEDVDAAFAGAYYAAGRAAGFEPDTRFLSGFDAAFQRERDSRMVLGFMLENRQALDRIEAITARAAALCRRYGVPPTNIHFHQGPFDFGADERRVHPELDDAALQARVAAAYGRFQEVVRKAGFPLAGHTMSLADARSKVGLGFRLFTVNGPIGTELAGPSLRELFGSGAAAQDLEWFHQAPRFSPEERAELGRVAERFRVPTP